MLANVNGRQCMQLTVACFTGEKLFAVYYLVASFRYLQFCHLSTLHNARGLAVKRADTQHKCDFCVNSIWHELALVL